MSNILSITFIFRGHAESRPSRVLWWTVSGDLSSPDLDGTMEAIRAVCRPSWWQSANPRVLKISAGLRLGIDYIIMSTHTLTCLV